MRRASPMWRGLCALVAGLAADAAQAGSVDVPVQYGGAYAVPTTSLREARYVATLRQQYDFSCGSAALATLLTHHYGRPVDENRIFEEMFRAGDQQKIRVEGFSLLDMKRYLEAHGFQADGFQEPVDRLPAAGIPAIVLINESGYNHFVVVKGLRDGRVLLGDPSSGTRAMSRARFEAMWVNEILFVISSHSPQARFNLESDWQVAPRAPIAQAGDTSGVASLPRLGPADF